MPATVFTSRPWLSSYAPGVPHEIAPTTQTLCDMFDDSVARFGPKPALDFFGATTGYVELGRRVARAAQGLADLGVVAGDRVALVLPNCPQHVIAFYAVLRLGAVVVEHNPLYTADELRHQFADHGATVAIVWDKVADTVLGFADELGVRTIIGVDMTAAMPVSMRLQLRLPIARAQAARRALTRGGLPAGVIPWRTIVSAAPLPDSHPRPALDDIAALQYTSGTTGRAKGAVLTHRNLRANAAQGRAWVPGLTEGGEVVYAVLPMFHAYGLTLCLTFALSIGARLVLFPRFDLDLTLDAMKRTPATFLPAVPPIYERLALGAAEKGVSLSGIRFAISGAMSLPVRIVELWESSTGGLLVEGYGMTESSPVAIGNPIGPSRRPGTIGVPFPSTEIRVVDPANPEVDRGFDVEGELLLRGPQVFQGYWNLAAETAVTLLPGGWLRTGDIVRVSPDGFVTVVDRIKELIITGGFNVAPTEVEEVLRGHPAVADVAVVGMPAAAGGEDVTAAIVLAPGARLDVAELRTFAKASLAAYKVPQRFEVVDELPRSLIGKVLRRQVRATLVGQAPPPA
jgi:long-chain acyl-CoA synthetase